MPNYDGSIILEVRPDTSKLEKSQNKIQRSAEKMSKGFSALGSTIAGAMNKGDAKAIQLTNALQKTTAEVEKQTSKVEALRDKLDGLKSGEITVKDANVTKLQKDFDKTNASIAKTKSEVSELYMQLDNLQLNAFKAPDTNEAVLTGKEQADFDRINAKLSELESRLKTDKAKAVDLGEALRSASGAATQQEINKTSTKLKDAEVKLDGLQRKAEQAGQKLKMAGASSSVSEISKGFEQMGKRITSLIRSALFFTVITKAFTKLRDTIGNVMMADEGFRRSLYALQAALWTAFTPILNYVVPAIKTLVNWLIAGITAITKFIAAITGKSYAAMVANAKAVKTQSDNYKALGSGSTKAAKAMKKTTDEAKKQLAAFDDLNILTSEQASVSPGDAGAGSGGAGGVDIFGGGDYDIAPITSKLQELMKVVGACLAAVGILLLFTGHVGWGIGFIIAGAAIFAVAQQSSQETNPTMTPQQQLAEFGQYLGGALLALGVMLCFFGHPGYGVGAILVGITALGVSSAVLQEGGITTKLTQFMKANEKIIVGVSIALLILGVILAMFTVMSPISLGLIAAGAVGLVSEITLNEGAVGEKIKTFLTDNAAIITEVSFYLLALGIIMCMCGLVTPLSIGLIAAGAVGLASEIVLNWDYVKTKTTEWISANTGLIIGVASAMLVLGIVLCMVGVLTWGIPLLVIGAGILVTEAVLNWNYISESITNFIRDNSGLIVGVSLALIVLGIILLFTGVGIPLAIGLIVAGGGALAATVAVNWNFIVDKISEVWNNVKNFWNTHIAKYFTAKWWGDLGKNAVNGLIRWFLNGLNWLIDKINSFGFDLPDVLGGGHVGFSIPKFQIPQLAKGGIVPYATAAIIGEAGKEAVLPLEHNTEWMDLLADRIIERSGGNAGRNSEIIIEIDGREFGRAVIEQGGRESRRVGGRMVFA